MSIFIGAGLSVPAGYVDWKSLLSELAQELNIDINTAQDLVDIAQQHIEFIGGRASINQHIVNALTKPAVLTKNHKLLGYFPLETFWTTNFDDLIEQGLRNSNKLTDTNYKTNVKFQQSQLVITNRDSYPIVYKMHGDYSTPNDTVITRQDFDKYLEKRGAFLDILCAELLQKKFLFVGISFTDPNLDLVFNKLRSQLGDALNTHWYFNKRVLRSDNNINSDEEFAIAIEKQATFVERLKVFRLRPVWIDSYSEITEILAEIYNTAALEEFESEKIKIKDGNSNNFNLLALADKYPAANHLLENLYTYFEYSVKDHNIAFTVLEKHLKVEPENVEKLTEKGSFLHNYYSKYEEAEKYFLKALAIDKSFSLAHTNIATNYKKLGNLDAAKYHLEIALKIEPNDQIAHANIGDLFITLEDNTKAKEHLEKAVELDPLDASSYHDLGVLFKRHLPNKELSKKYFLQSLQINNENEETHLTYGLLLMEDFNDHAQARTHFEKALKLNQKNYKAHWFIAKLLNRTDTDPLGAQIRLQDAIELNSKDGQLYTELGETYFKENKENWQLAITAFERAIDLDSTDFYAYFSLGYLTSIYQNDDQSAKGYFLRALELNKTEPNVYLNLGNVYLNLNEFENAEIIYQQLLDNLGPSAIAHCNLGSLFYNKGLFVRAVDQLNKGLLILESDSNFEDEQLGSKLYFNLAQTYANGLQDFNKARLLLEQSIQMHQPRGEDYFLLGAILNNHFQDYPAAKEFAERAVQLMPNFADAHFNLGIIHSNLEENTLALESLHKAVELDENSFKVNYKLGVIYQEIEKSEQAVKYYTKAQLIDNNNVDCIYQLAKIYATSLNNEAEAALLYDSVLELSGYAEKYYPQAAVTYFNLSKALAHEDRQNSVKLMMKAKQLAIGEWENHNKFRKYIKYGFYRIATVEAQAGRLNNALFYLDTARTNDTLEDENAIKDCSDMLAVIAQSIYKDVKDTNKLLLCKKLFKEAISLNPGADYNYTDLGLIETNLGNHTEAIEAYSKSVALNPNQAKTYYNMGAIYQNSFKDYVNAKNCYEKSFQLIPEIAEANNNMGMLLEIENKYAEAKTFYLKALEINPNLTQAKNNLNRLNKQKFN